MYIFKFSFGLEFMPFEAHGCIPQFDSKKNDEIAELYI